MLKFVIDTKDYKESHQSEHFAKDVILLNNKTSNINSDVRKYFFNSLIKSLINYNYNC